MYDKLVKEIDSLTYNSRSVLNGMIRSTMAAGSDTGFSVNRSGVKVELSRVDIYRLSKFYKEWESNDFSLVDISETTNTREIKSFDTIRLEHDTIPVRNDDGSISSNNATTVALVNHSRVLYLNNSNSSNSEDQLEFWLNTLKSNSVNNPKLITNSAPIPLNLRTPVYDENLATTKYNSNPTYLFPKSYYDLDTLGYSGDGVDHSMGGNSWAIESDNYINIESPKVMVGLVDSNASLKTFDNRVNTNSFVWGRDTHARGLYSTSGGISSIATANGSVAIGIGSIASASRSISMGHLNEASAISSLSIAGTNNNAVGNYSAVVAGINNTTGSSIDQWSMVVESEDDDCLKEVIDCTFKEGVANPLKNIIVIAGNASKYSISETVRLFGFTYGDGTSTVMNQDGNAETAITAVIQNISYDEVNNKTNIVLDKSVDYVGVAGGNISRVKEVNGLHIGYGSIASGQNTIASGNYQTVFGRFNRESRDAKFVVGTGTGETTRRNSLEVAEDYSVIYGNNADAPVVSENGGPTFNRFVGLYNNKNSSTLLSNTAYIQVNDTVNGAITMVSTKGALIKWEDGYKLTLNGNTFETLSADNRSRAHNLDGVVTTLDDLTRSGFYRTSSGVSTGLSDSIGETSTNTFWHVIQNTIDIDDNYYSMQIAKNPLVGADDSRLAYRVVNKNNIGVITKDDWSTIATTDDVDIVDVKLEDFITSRENDGIWKFLSDGEVTANVNQVDSSDVTYSLSRGSGNNTYSLFDFGYTVIGKTLHYTISISNLTARPNIKKIRVVTGLAIDPFRSISSSGRLALFNIYTDSGDSHNIYSNVITRQNGNGDDRLTFEIYMEDTINNTFPNESLDLTLNGTIVIK
jgi:hypothetical protein